MSIYDDLNRSLFLQLDKLQDCEPDELDAEIERSKQVAALASQVVANQNSAISLVRLQASVGMGAKAIQATLPKAIGDGR